MTFRFCREKACYHTTSWDHTINPVIKNSKLFLNFPDGVFFGSRTQTS